MKRAASSEPESRFPLSDALHAEECQQYAEHEARQRAIMAAVVKEYPLPAVRGRATIAPADDPWADAPGAETDGLIDADEVSAVDANDRPPKHWRHLSADVRRHLVGYTLYLCDLLPRDQQLVGERRDKLRSIFGMGLIVLGAGEVPAGLSSADQAFFSHFVLQPADRGVWREVQLDVLRHFGGNGAVQLEQDLIARLDRVSEGGVVAAIKAGIARALAALKTRRALRDPWLSR